MGWRFHHGWAGRSWAWSISDAATTAAESHVSHRVAVRRDDQGVVLPVSQVTQSPLRGATGSRVASGQRRGPSPATWVRPLLLPREHVVTV
jgi:hypothetical protein